MTGPASGHDDGVSGHICPVCGFDGLLEPAYGPGGSPSYEICSACGYEFGFDDDSEGVSQAAHREKWVASGAPWFDPEAKPDDWDLETQLARVTRD